MHAIDAGVAGRAWTELGRKLPRPARRTDGVGALGNIDTDADRKRASGDDSRLRRLSRRSCIGCGIPRPARRKWRRQSSRVSRPRESPAASTACAASIMARGCRCVGCTLSADIPVVQLSVQPDHDTEYHLRLGSALRPFADEGVLIIGSGHATHNLRDWAASRRSGQPMPYVDAFSRWLQQNLASGDADALTHYRDRAPGSRARASDRGALSSLVRCVGRGRKRRTLGAHRRGLRGRRAVAGFVLVSSGVRHRVH